MADDKTYFDPPVYQFRPPVVLPLVYDKSISLLEKVHYITARINQLIDYVNELETNANDYTDEKIAGLKAELLSRIQTIQYQIDQINYRIDNIGNDWDIKLKRQFDTLIDILSLSQNKQNIEFKYLLDDLRRELISMLEFGFPVIDPTTGKTTTVQVALDNMYNVLRAKFSITVGEYRPLNLTVSEYRDYYITVEQYRSSLKDELYEFFGNLFDPFTGKRTTQQMLFNKLASFHMTSPYVAEYRIKELTVESYRALNLTLDAYRTGF